MDGTYLFSLPFGSHCPDFMLVQEGQKRLRSGRKGRLSSRHPDQEQPSGLCSRCQHSAPTRQRNRHYFGWPTDSNGAWSGRALAVGLASLRSRWSHSGVMRRLQASLSNRTGSHLGSACWLAGDSPVLWMPGQTMPTASFPGLSWFAAAEACDTRRNRAIGQQPC